MKKRLKFMLGIRVGVLLLIGGGFVGGFTVITPHTDYTIEPIHREVFVDRNGDAEVPLSATNILYANSTVSMGFAGASLYRFDAPVPDCLAFADHLIEHNNREATDGSRKVSTNLVHLAAPPPPIGFDMLKAYGLTRIHWFDVERVKSGVEGRGPPNGRGLFWIDTERGRFYYCWMD